LSSTIINDWGGPLSVGPLEWLWPESQSDGNATAPKFAMPSAMMDSASAAITLNAQALLHSDYCRVDVPLSSPVASDDTSTAAYHDSGIRMLVRIKIMPVLKNRHAQSKLPLGQEINSPVARKSPSKILIALWCYEVMDSSLQSYYASIAYTNVKNWIQNQILSQRLNLTGARLSVG
jgi:hypothetical protein